MEYTMDEKIACLSREVKMRQKVYPRQVQEGRIDAAMAKKELGIMVEILAEYQAQLDAVQPSLF
jgi:hypothetical protein